MEHMLLKATTAIAQDVGVFEAVISAESIDREKDIVDPAGMVRALRKWVPTGKKIPLAWNHSTKADEQIGYVDPASAQVVNSEVVVKGWIDQSIEAGQHAWRLVKMGTLGFSFGYLVPNGGATKRAGGGNHIKEMDVFEVTASPTPMNNDTRVLGWKAAMPMSDEAETDDQPPTADQMRILNSMIGQAQEYIASDPDAEDAAEMAEVIETLEELRGEPDTEDEGPDAQSPEKAVGKSLRKRADAVAFEHAAGGKRPKAREKAQPEPPEDTLAPLLVAIDEMADFTEANFKAAYVNGLLARVRESNFTQAVKDELTAKAQRILDAQKTVEVTGKEPRRARSADPLRAKADAMALEHASGGESLKKPPQPAPKAPVDLLPLKELKRRMREEMLTALSGKEN